MLTHTLKTHGEIFAQAQAITGTPTPGNMNATVEAGAHQGGLALAVLASGPVTVAADGDVTLHVEHGPQADGAFLPLISLSAAAFPGFAEGFSALDGQELAVFPLPDARRFIRVKLSGAALTGKVDVALRFLPR